MRVQILVFWLAIGTSQIVLCVKLICQCQPPRPNRVWLRKLQGELSQCGWIVSIVFLLPAVLVYNVSHYIPLRGLAVGDPIDEDLQAARTGLFQ